MARLTILPEENETRLDHVLERLLPGMGLRGRRRVCELGLATINGQTASPSRKVRTGEVVEVREEAPLTASEDHIPPLPGEDGSRLFPDDRARLIAETPHLAALYKPAAMHTESLAGNPEQAFRACCPNFSERNVRPGS